MSESRVVADHRIMGGVPCRIPVATIVGRMAPKRSVERILTDYPQLLAVRELQVPLRTTA